MMRALHTVWDRIARSPRPTEPVLDTPVVEVVPPPVQPALADIDPPAALGGTLTAEAPCRISSGVFSGTCSVGAFSYINHGTEIADTIMGRYCSIGQRVLIGPGMHHTDMVTTHPIASDVSGASAGLSGNALYRDFAFNTYTKAHATPPGVVIGHDVWIGANAIVMRGVTIGNGAVIGAAAVVTRDVEPYSIVVGSPARHVRYRLDDEVRARLMASRWWEYDLSKLAQRDYSQPLAFLAALEAAGELPQFNPVTRTF